MAFAYPPINKRMEAFKDWVKWTSGCKVVWRDQADGGRVREANETWVELRPTKMSQVGTTEIRHVDVDNEDGDAENPRQDVYYSTYVVQFEVRAFSRSQEHDASAWGALWQAHSKTYNRFGHEKYLIPNTFSVNTVSDVINMPQFEPHDLRIEDVALFEIDLNTVLVDCDAAAVGTWIESTEMSSDLKDAGGVSLPASLQLDDEVMP